MDNKKGKKHIKEWLSFLNTTFGIIWFWIRAKILFWKINNFAINN